jgi:hypothetical protein
MAMPVARPAAPRAAARARILEGRERANERMNCTGSESECALFFFLFLQYKLPPASHPARPPPPNA